MDTVTLLVSIATFLISVFSLVAAVHANRAGLFERRFEVYKDVEEDMILVYADGDTSGTQKLYAALPDKAMLPLVPGFTPIAEDKVPAQARFLVGYNKTYSRLFGKKV
jgi:hypothetical protein